MNLVLLTFGERLENHYQAMFALLSFFKDPLIKRVTVITDKTDFYRFAAEHIDIMPVDQNILNEWQEPYRFFWRIKIKALEAVLARCPDEHLLYIDSDTFLAGDLNPLYIVLEQGRTVMHQRECALADEPDKTLRKMHRTLRGKTLDGIRVTGQSAMWNAGVIGLPAQKAKSVLQSALRICDEICATACPRRLAEQFAFSLALNHAAPLCACDQTIGHYWGNKSEWNAAIAEFFVQALFQRLSFRQCVQRAAAFDRQVIPLNKKQRRTNQILKKLVDNLFKDKNIRYFPTNQSDRHP